MTARLALLLLIPTTLFAQIGAIPDSPARIEIRSADSGRVLNVRIEAEGALIHSVGVLRPGPGTVRMAGREGVATTPAIMELSTGTGIVDLSVPENGPKLEVSVIRDGAADGRLVAIGHAVSLRREDSGSLKVRAASMERRSPPSR